MATENEQGIDRALHAEWVERRRAAFPNPGEVNLCREYARGVQKVTLTREHTKWLRGLRLQFCKNVVNRVLSAVANRIEVMSWRVPHTTAQSFLDSLWTLNALEDLQGQLIYAAWRDGNYGATLAWDNDNGRVVISLESWWNGEEGLFVAYDERGRPEWALKEWATLDGPRRTFYGPGEIRRYINSGNGWQWFQDNPKSNDALDPAGPIPWRAGEAEDAPELGIAAVHFKRSVQPPDASKKDKGSNQRDRNYGFSFLLQNQLVGLQDALNDVLKMIVAAARFTAFQILWSSGFKPPKTEEAEEGKVKVLPGDMLHSTDAAARFGAIPAGDIGQLVRAKDTLQEDIADAATVPLHVIRGQWPSGEAMFRSELPLIDQARRGAACLGPQFASLAHKACKLQNHFGGGFNGEQIETSAATAPITTVFADPERYDPLTRTRLARERADYVSLQETHRLMGYSAAQSKRIIREMRKEASFRPPAAIEEPPDDEFEDEQEGDEQ